MTIEFDYSDSYFQQIIDETEQVLRKESLSRTAASSLFGCLDHTSLNGSDSPQSIRLFCEKVKQMHDKSIPSVAAVCVYPCFVEEAKKVLEGSGIHVAAVAGGFPAGQLPQQLKMEEVRWLVDSGADEVDYVINRGMFLQGESQYLFDEVAAAKSLCGKVPLKVILETGELSTTENIYCASMLALQAGADFIKTSTGKIPVGATPLSATVMMVALRDFLKKNNSTAGFKAAGGISTPSEAWCYALLMEKILGVKNITNQIFRIGTSRLTPQLFNFLTNL